MKNDHKNFSQQSKKPASLMVSKANAQEKIQKQINEGEQLLNIEIENEPALNDLKEDKKIWNDYTKELLKNIFSTTEIADEYGIGTLNYFPTRSTFYDRIGYIHNSITTLLTRLRSIYKRLELFSESDSITLKTRNKLLPEELIFF